MEYKKQIVGFFCSNSCLVTDKGFSPTGNILDFLLQYRKSINCFYHLSANCASLFRILGLTFDQLFDLYEIGEIHIDPDYTLFYLHNKYLGIKKGYEYNGPYAQFCDISQYIPWHIDDNSDIDYAKQKALEAKVIGSIVYQGLLDIGLMPDNLTSPIRVYEKQVLNTMELPTVDDIPEQAGEYAYYCTYGGWLESFRKGSWSNTWDYDISSAYPAELVKLLDLRQGKWIQDPAYHPEAAYGYLSGYVNIKGNFSPILFKNIEMTYTPIGKWESQEMKPYCINKRQYEVIYKYGLGNFYINNAWWFIPDPDSGRPLQPLVNYLYFHKEKSTGIQRDNIKRIMSGIWGKLLEIQGDTFGIHFNPVWGSEVEINTRLNVFEMCVKNNILPLSIAVDGVLTDKQLDITGSGLGNWKLSSSCPALVISSGIVAVKDKEHIHDFSLSYDWLLDAIKSDPQKSEYEMKKPSPVTLENAINRNIVSRLGNIETITRVIDVTYEHKRFYSQRPSTGQDLLDNKYVSDPWDISLVKGLKGTLNLFPE